MTDQSSKKYNDAATKKLVEVLVTSKRNQEEIVKEIKQLIVDGADVNYMSKYGMTPLMIASGTRTLDVVRTLLEAGAHPFSKTKDGLTAGIFASMNKIDREGEIDKFLSEIPEVEMECEQDYSIYNPNFFEARNRAEIELLKLNLMPHANEYSVQEALFLVLTELRNLHNDLHAIDHTLGNIYSSIWFIFTFKYSRR